MTDAIALLALSQLICLGGLGYLYLQLQEVRKALARASRGAPRTPAPAQGARAARAYAAQPATRPRPELATLAAQLQDGTADVAALARRLNRSEEEIRLLLRSRGVLS